MRDDIFRLNSPHNCFYCCGSTYVRILEEAADTLTAEEAVQIIVSRLSTLGEKRQEYEIKKLAEKFRRLANIPPSLKARGPKFNIEKSVLRPDFSSHPTHRKWSVSTGACAPPERTPYTYEHFESQRSQKHKNKTQEGH